LGGGEAENDVLFPIGVAQFRAIGGVLQELAGLHLALVGGDLGDLVGGAARADDDGSNPEVLGAHRFGEDSEQIEAGVGIIGDVIVAWSVAGD
jgi:hypothetical protein